jgi:hypothetical protein
MKRKRSNRQLKSEKRHKQCSSEEPIDSFLKELPIDLRLMLIERIECTADVYSLSLSCKCMNQTIGSIKDIHYIIT